MFRDINVGDYVIVYGGFNRPCERKIVCEVNDKSFKCNFDSKSYSRENGKSSTFAFAIPYDEEKWKTHCFVMDTLERRRKALDVVRRFYHNSDKYSIEECELIAETIGRIIKN